MRKLAGAFSVLAPLGWSRAPPEPCKVHLRKNATEKGKS
jgi:hypothetical protein